MTIEKILKYAIWTGLIGICFIPLVVFKEYFFPFIVPKTLVFRIIAEIIFLAYLGLAVLKKEYRPRLNLVLVLFVLYLAVVYLSSALGDSFSNSFWSSNERSEGLLLLTHLLLFLFVASGFLRRIKDWLIVFEASFLSSIMVSLVALKQYLDPEWGFLGSMGRLASTIGNAGYVAGYLLFNIFFALLLFFYRKNKALRWYYILGIVLQIFVIVNTLTRGGIIALVLALMVFIGYLAFFYFKKHRAYKLVKNSGLAIIVLVVIVTSLVFINKDTTWVQDNKVLSRIVRISASAPTAQNRLMTWNSAWQGFKERPILGYGYENFYQPFDKYFNPKIRRHAGSVVWFDRAHNIVFDRLITGGIIGLLLYLSLLFAPLYFLWRYYKKKNQEERYLIPVIFTLIVSGYFVQNLFIFEALVTYIPLFLVLAFLGQYCPAWWPNFTQSKKPYLVLLTIGVIILVPILYSVNIKPVTANKELVQAIIKSNMSTYEEANDKYLEVIEMETAHNQEYKQHFAEFTAGLLSASGLDQNWRNQAISRGEEELEKQVEQTSHNVRVLLMTMRYYNKTFQININRLYKSLELFEEAKKLSPTRPSLYIEASFSQIYLAHYLEEQGDEEKANEYYDQAIANMQKSIDLNDQVTESYVNMIVILLNTGRIDQIQAHIDKMDELNLKFRNRQDFLGRMGSAAISSQTHQWTAYFYESLVKLSPNEPNYWINLALAYAHLGENEKAIEMAEEIRRLGEDYNAEADAFIQKIKEGYFKEK